MSNGDAVTILQAIGKYSVGTIFAAALLWIVVEFQIRPNAVDRTILIESLTTSSDKVADAVVSLKDTMTGVSSGYRETIQQGGEMITQQKKTQEILKGFTDCVIGDHQRAENLLNEINDKLDTDP